MGLTERYQIDLYCFRLPVGWVVRDVWFANGTAVSAGALTTIIIRDGSTV